MKLKAMALASALAAVAVTGAGAAQAASLLNGSFEQGFEGWTPSDEGLIQLPDSANHFDADGQIDNRDLNGVIVPYVAQDGDVFAALTAGAIGIATTLTRTFETAGGEFAISAAFLGEDYIDPNGLLYPDHPGVFDDHGYVRISGLADDVFFSNITAVGNFGRTEWGRYTVNLLPGVYTLEIGVVNVGDGVNDSRLLVDAINAPAAVPEPASWAMMILGFFGLGLLLRRRRRAFA